MKPDWQDAPPWANWLTCNQLGAIDFWHWHELKPDFPSRKTSWVSEGRSIMAYCGSDPYFEPRPQATTGQDDGS